MPTPAVTVCIPTYNYGHYLGGTIASVLDQTFEDFELLIADDVSTDNTDEVVKPFLGDPRVEYLPNDVNSGMFDNFNRCIERARGRYIKFLMADDWLAPDFLERMVELLDAHPDVNLATTGGWQIDVDGRVFADEIPGLGSGPRVAAVDVVAASARGANSVGMPTCTLLRTKALREAGGFDAEYQPAADIHLWFKMLAVSDLCFLPVRLTFLRIHESHTHEWGDEPQEIFYKVWRDAAAANPTAVDRRVADWACRRWSVRFLIFAGKHRIRGNSEHAHQLIKMVRRNVGLGPALVALIMRTPRLLHDRCATEIARRSGRLIKYRPYAQVGEKLPAARARAEADKGPGLKRALEG